MEVGASSQARHGTPGSSAGTREAIVEGVLQRSVAVAGFLFIAEKQRYISCSIRWASLGLCLLQSHPKAADFCHKITKEPLWLHGCHIPSWVPDMLKLEHLEELSPQNVPVQKEQLHLLPLDDALFSLEQGLYSPPIKELACFLYKCKKERSREHVLRMHDYIQRNGLTSCVPLGNTLVSALVEVGCIHHAQGVFDGLTYHDERGWNSLIVGYCKLAEPHHALELYQKMQKSEGHLSLTGHTLVALLKACAIVKDVKMTCALNAEIVRKGFLEKDLHIRSTLIHTYAKCGLLAKAQHVFDKAFVRDAVLWTSLISGYVEHGCADKALDCYEQMQQQCVTPDRVTFVCTLKACGMLGNTTYSRHIAQQVFDMLPSRDIVFWNALLAGYVEHGFGKEALKCYENMKQEGIFPNDITYVCLLKACGSIGDIDTGQEVYAEVIVVGLDNGLSVGSTVVNMYVRCNSLKDAQAVFNGLSVRGVVTWNTLMAGYAETCGEKALDCFRHMQLDYVPPDAVTFVCCLKACVNSSDLNTGLNIHVQLVREGLDADLVVGSTLICMYGKFGFLAKGREVFDKLPVHDAVSWNALITGYVENGHCEEALNCFEESQRHDIYPHPLMLGCILKACASIRHVPRGQKIHAELARRGLEGDIALGSTLIDFYAKCGLLATAQKVFDKLPTLDVVSWNTLIAGYTNFGCGKMALQYFDQMPCKGVSPDDFTYACILKACNRYGVTMHSQELHAAITRKGLEKELFVGSTLVNAYARCGSPVEAQSAFSIISDQDVVSWTALIAGYALQLGETHNTVRLLEKMIGAGIEPNIITIANVLNACSHSGLVDKGQMYFESISNAYRVIPTNDHYICMLDLLGRAGHMQEAVAVIKNMPFHPGSVVWDTMLGACRKWRTVEIGRLAFEHAIRADERNAAAYICMSNIYADAAIQDCMNAM